MSTVAQRSDHITQVRQRATGLIINMDALHALRREWDALGLSTGITDADMIGENAGLTAANIAAVYTSLEAIDTLMEAGHGTNLYTVSL